MAYLISIRNSIIVFMFLTLSANVQALPPEGFVYLYDIDPTIEFEIKNFYEDNFVGTKLNGYNQPMAILTEKAALALKAVQEDMLKDGYKLVVYEAYRPRKANAHIMRWYDDLDDQKMKERFYPNIDKRDLLKLGYLSEHSPYSRGSTVAVTFMVRVLNLKQPVASKRNLYNGRSIPYFDDGTMDMGSSYGLFDGYSSYPNENLNIVSDVYRKYLFNKMTKHGFVPSKLVWWQFTLKDEPFPNDDFDFDIE